MARTTRGRKTTRVLRRLLSPVVQGVGLLKNVGKSSLRFASNLVRSTGRRVRKTANNLRGKTRRSRKNQSSRRRR
jgi:hypothetical protein